MKWIRVSLIGEVCLPGCYNVSSLHTALQVLRKMKRRQGLRISSLVAHCCLEQQKDLDKGR